MCIRDRFRLTVTNEGSVAATQIALSDSLPAGLTLADAAWTASGLSLIHI